MFKISCSNPKYTRMVILFCNRPSHFSADLLRILKWMKTVWDLGILLQLFVCLCIPRWLDRLSLRQDQHSQPQANKEQILSSHISRSKLTGSGVTDNTALPFNARLTEMSCGQAIICVWSELLGRHSMIFLCIRCNPCLWFCDSETVHL